MSQQGSRISVADYLHKHPKIVLSDVERGQLESCSLRLFLLGNKLLARLRPGLPESLRDSVILQFTNYDTVQAKAGGFAPDLNIISISMGLIHLIFSLSRGLALEAHTRQDMESIMLMLVLGHELTHVVFGHNEFMDVDPLEASAMEVHSDYFCGIYLAQLLHKGEVNVAQDDAKAVLAVLASLLLFAELRGERTDTYHSSPVRLMIVLGGYLRWALENSRVAAESAQRILELANLKRLLSESVKDQAVFEKACACIQGAMAADENINESLAAAERFRQKWHERSTLLAPIRDQLGTG